MEFSQRHRAKQQFSKNSKWKLLTPIEKEKHLIPYHFYSKADNLRQVEFRIVFKAVLMEVSD